MSINPTAEKLKSVTRIAYSLYTTYSQRDEAGRLFREEVGQLLNQQAESTAKHAVELYKGNNDEMKVEAGERVKTV